MSDHRIMHRATVIARRLAHRHGFIDLAPVAFTILALWVKLAYFSYLVPGEWWASEERIKAWLRPALHILGFLLAHPHVAIATAASVLLIVTPFPLLSRMWRFMSLLLLNLVVTTLGLADVVHARFYGDVLSVSDLLLAPALEGILPSILKLVQPADAIYYVDILLGCAMLPIYLKHHRKLGCVEAYRPARISAALAL